jgi:hypothetical protein
MMLEPTETVAFLVWTPITLPASIVSHLNSMVVEVDVGISPYIVVLFAAVKANVALVPLMA